MRKRVRGPVNPLSEALGWPGLWKFVLLAILPSVAWAGLSAAVEINLQAILAGQYSAARERYPSSELFEVIVNNFVPEPSSSDEVSSPEIHSYFQIGKTDSFLEVTSRDSKKYQQVVRPFAGKDCFHGYPVSRSEACLPSVQPPTTQEEYLRFDWTVNPAMIAAALRKSGLDPSRHFDITIASATRVLNSWRGANAQQPPVRDTLRKQQSNEIVISATEHSSSGQSVGPTCLFRGSDYTYLGSLVISTPKTKLPPTR